MSRELEAAGLHTSLIVVYIVPNDTSFYIVHCYLFPDSSSHSHTSARDAVHSENGARVASVRLQRTFVPNSYSCPEFTYMQTVSKDKD